MRNADMQTGKLEQLRARISYERVHLETRDDAHTQALWRATLRLMEAMEELKIAWHNRREGE
jgi:hypothetical protein